jgi:hypothetical protein
MRSKHTQRGEQIESRNVLPTQPLFTPWSIFWIGVAVTVFLTVLREAGVFDILSYLSKVSF